VTLGVRFVLVWLAVAPLAACADTDVFPKPEPHGFPVAPMPLLRREIRPEPMRCRSVAARPSIGVVYALLARRFYFV